MPAYPPRTQPFSLSSVLYRQKIESLFEFLYVDGAQRALNYQQEKSYENTKHSKT